MGRVVAIVLAAGESRRMGKLKPLLPYGSGSVIQAVVRSLKASRVDEVRVVLGHRTAEIEENLAAEGVTILRNPRYLEGMLTSVQEGMASAPGDTEWFVIALGDQPSLRAATVVRLLQAAREEPADSGNERPTIVVPSYGGRRGHPLLISAAHREDIGALPDEGGLRELLRRHPDTIRHVTLDDERVLEDMDTPEEYQRQIERLGGEPPSLVSGE